MGVGSGRGEAPPAAGKGQRVSKGVTYPAPLVISVAFRPSRPPAGCPQSQHTAPSLPAAPGVARGLWGSSSTSHPRSCPHAAPFPQCNAPSLLRLYADPRPQTHSPPFLRCPIRRCTSNPKGSLSPAAAAAESLNTLSSPRRTRGRCAGSSQPLLWLPASVRRAHARPATPPSPLPGCSISASRGRCIVREQQEGGSKSAAASSDTM